MKTEDIEKLASKNAPMPDKLTPPEMFLFLNLRAVYSTWRAGVIATAQAKNEKNKIMNQYNELKLWHMIYIQQSAMLRNVQRYSDKIGMSGCDVCKGLYNALCGITEVQK